MKKLLIIITLSSLLLLTSCATDKSYFRKAVEKEDPAYCEKIDSDATILREATRGVPSVMLPMRDYCYFRFTSMDPSSLCPKTGVFKEYCPNGVVKTSFCKYGTIEQEGKILCDNAFQVCNELCRYTIGVQFGQYENNQPIVRCMCDIPWENLAVK